MRQPRDRLTPQFAFGPKKPHSEPPKAAPRSEPPSRRAGQAPPAPLLAPPAIAPAAGQSPPPAPAPTPETQPIAPAFQEGFRQWAGAPKATLAIVFTDMVGSAALGTRLGNQAMAALRRAHFDRARGLVAVHGGYLVKTMGDSVMAAFRAAVDALDFALAIHADTGDRQIRVRAGIHIGPVSIEEQDAYGATVNYAARVVGQSSGPEVWLSSEAKRHIDEERAPQHAGLIWRPHVDLELKGFPGRHTLWSVMT